MIETPQEVHTLLGRAQIDLALNCLGSMLTRSQDPLQLVLHDDGSLGPAEEERLLMGLPGSILIPRREADERAEEMLRGHFAAQKLRREYVLSLKLLDIPLFGTNDIAYCDTDIYFFQNFRGLFEFPEPGTSSLFMMDMQNAYSVRAADLFKLRSVRLPQRLNTGMYLVRRSVYDLDFVDWFLQKRELFLVPHWAEQTCWAMLGFRAGCRLWDPRQVWLAHSRQRPPSSIVAGHFTQPSRWMMQELIQTHSAPREAPAACVGTVESKRCGALRLGINQLRNRWGKRRDSWRASPNGE